MTGNSIITALLVAAVMAFFVAPACAREKSLGSFGAWHAYRQNEGGQTVCYMVTTKLVKGSVVKRATPYVMITHRPTEASIDVFSYGAGMLLNDRRNAVLRVGTANFDLFSVRDTAWARDAQTDHRIARAMQIAPTAQVKTYPSKKNARVLNDVFDLTGASDAYHAIGKACGLSEDKPKKVTKKPLVSAHRAKTH